MQYVTEELTPNSSLPAVDIQGSYLTCVYDMVCDPSTVSEETYTGLFTS